MTRWLPLVAFLLGGPAFAETPEGPPKPTHRLVMENLTAVRYNPLGLQEYFTLSYRLRLMDSDSMLFSDTYFQVGPTVALSPAFAKAGVAFRLVPIAMFEAGGSYRYQYFFGNFDHVIPFDSTAADWSDSGLEERTDESEPMGGHLITLSARLQGKVWNIAIRNSARWEYTSMPGLGDAVGYYDQTPDMLMPNDGWMFVNDLDVIYLAGPLRAGVRYTATVPWFGDGGGDEGNQSQRVGPLVTYTFFEKPGAAFDKPTLILLSQWHVQHRFRTGADVSAAIPYIALAFSFEGDLLPW